MDFLECLCARINEITDLPTSCEVGILEKEEGLRLYAVPGGKVTQVYFDGSQDEQLSYALAYKSKDQEETIRTLWVIQTVLEKLDTLSSKNGSFVFKSIRLTDKPFIDHVEAGIFTVLMNFQAEVTTY